MIARLAGTLILKQPPLMVIDIGGVGYEVEAPLSVFYDLPELGSPVVILTHLSIKDDSHTLYGFASESERTLFRQLLKISGIGAKLALTILSGMDAGSFAACVQAGDTAALVKLPGVGKKTAERLVVEMRDRLAGWDTGGAAQGAAASAPADVANPVEEAVSALIALGYKPQDASRMVRAVDSRDVTTEEIIGAGLVFIAAVIILASRRREVRSALAE